MDYIEESLLQFNKILLITTFIKSHKFTFQILLSVKKKHNTKDNIPTDRLKLNKMHSKNSIRYYKYQDNKMKLFL